MTLTNKQAFMRLKETIIRVRRIECEVRVILDVKFLVALGAKVTDTSVCGVPFEVSTHTDELSGDFRWAVTIECK